jgi:hypothetical protein
MRLRITTGYLTLSTMALAAILGLAPGCDGQAPPGSKIGQPVTSKIGAAKQTPARAANPTRFEDAVTGVRFAIPEDLAVEAQHFDATTPEEKIRDSFTLASLRADVLAIDLWQNPRALPLAKWFDENLSFVRDGNEFIKWRGMTRAGVTGMLIERPRSVQAYGQRIALFEAGSRIVRVTCVDEDDPRALAAFELVLGSFEWGVQR